MNIPPNTLFATILVSYKSIRLHPLGHGLSRITEFVIKIAIPIPANTTPHMTRGKSGTSLHQSQRRALIRINTLNNKNNTPKAKNAHPTSLATLIYTEIFHTLINNQDTATFIFSHLLSLSIHLLKGAGKESILPCQRVIVSRIFVASMADFK